MLAIAALLFHQAAKESSLLSDAGNWSAIVAAGILIMGVVFGWFRQVSHSLHVASEKILVGVDAEGVFVAPSIDLLNTAGIPLGYQVTTFTAAIGGREPVSVVDEDEWVYMAPRQQTDWNGERQRVEQRELIEGDLRIEVRYEVQYGRKSSAMRWWRRAICGGYGIDLPSLAAGEPMTLLAEPLDGPRTDTRVPWTSKTILGWRL